MDLANVFVVDDDVEVSRSLTLFLNSVGLEARGYTSGEQFLSEVEGLQPGCILLDIRMAGLDAFDVMKSLGSSRERLATIVMTGHGDIATAVKAMRSGAVDFIEKPFEEELILRAITRGFELLEHKVRVHARRTAALELVRTLTPRETEVLKGMIDGRPNKLLAHDLGISVRTVEVHRANIMDRLGAKSAAQVIRIAYDADLIDRRAAGLGAQSGGRTSASRGFPATSSARAI